MEQWVGPAVTATVISSIIAIAGWIVSWRTARRLDGDRRQERIIDVQTALLAEIRSASHSLGQYDRESLISSVRKHLETDKSGTYVPFVPREPGAPVFQAIVAEVSIFPTEVIDPVILFYTQQQAIEHFAEDLRSDRFSKLPNEQKVQMLEDFLDLKNHSLKLSVQAIEALQVSLGINIPGGGLSDPKSVLAASASEVS